MIEQITTLPPQILQFFNAALLSTPAPKLRDSCDTFDRMWKEVLKLWKRLDGNPQRKQRCEALKQEILELYERAKAKEKEREAEKDHKTQEFGYRVAVPEGLAEDVHARLDLGRKGGSFRHKFRENNAVQKVQKRVRR